jgi:hypothetical protein
VVHVCLSAALLFGLLRASLETQIPLGSLPFPRVSNAWGCNLNKPFSSLWGTFHPWICFPLPSKVGLRVSFSYYHRTASEYVMMMGIWEITRPYALPRALG